MIPAASLFSGMGASSLGLRQAGFDVRYACEIDDLAVATYELNLGLRVDHTDVRAVTAERILAACSGVAPYLDGSPPCSSFTTIGRRDLESDDAALYWEAVRIVREAVELGSPFPTFGFENVLGFASGQAYGRHFEPILNMLRGLGYRVGARILDASWLGVPQERKRVVVIGVREELGVDPPFPRPGKARTAIADALPDVARVVALPARHYGVVRDERTWHRSEPMPTITGGGMAERSRGDLWVELIDGRRRRLTVADLLVLSGFRPDFRFPEGVSDAAAWGMVGRCVPPPMAAAWARPIVEALSRAPRESPTPA